MTSLYVKLIVRAIMNFPGSHGYSIIKNLLALIIVTERYIICQSQLINFVRLQTFYTLKMKQNLYCMNVYIEE